MKSDFRLSDDEEDEEQKMRSLPEVVAAVETDPLLTDATVTAKEIRAMMREHRLEMREEHRLEMREALNHQREEIISEIMESRLEQGGRQVAMTTEGNQAIISQQDDLRVSFNSNGVSTTAGTCTSLFPRERRFHLFRSLVPSTRNVINVQNDEHGHRHTHHALEEDVFSLMMINRPCSAQGWRSWALALFTLLVFQLGLAITIMLDLWIISNNECILKKSQQTRSYVNYSAPNENCLPFDIPMRVGLEVNIAQFIAITLVVATQSDVLTSIQTVITLWNAESVPWDEVIDAGKEEENDDDDDNDEEEEQSKIKGKGKAKSRRTWCLWTVRILLPNVLKFIQGLIILFASFVIIIQSDNIVDLLKDFTALLVVSEADNIIFHLALLGYLGEHLAQKTAEVRTVRWMTTVEEEEEGRNEGVNHYWSRMRTFRGGCRYLTGWLNLRVCIFFTLCTMMIGGLSYIVIGQWNHKWMRMRFPKCVVEYPEAIGDGYCLERIPPYNTEECGYDGGDCPPPEIVAGYSGKCKVTYPELIGDGRCEDWFPYSAEDCGFDGGDCIPKAVEGYDNCFVHDTYKIGDGYCDYAPYNTPECGYDGGDCSPPFP